MVAVCWFVVSLLFQIYQTSSSICMSWLYLFSCKAFLLSIVVYLSLAVTDPVLGKMSGFTQPFHASVIFLVLSQAIWVIYVKTLTRCFIAVLIYFSMRNNGKMTCSCSLYPLSIINVTMENSIYKNKPNKQNQQIFFFSCLFWAQVQPFCLLWEGDQNNLKVCERNSYNKLNYFYVSRLLKWKCSVCSSPKRGLNLFRNENWKFHW